MCQIEKTNEKTLDSSSSTKLRNNPEKLVSCYKEVADNIQELKELGALPDFIVMYDISGGIGDGNNGGGTQGDDV